MKKAPLKIFLVGLVATFFAACSATGDFVGGDEDELSSGVQKKSSSSVAESSSSKVKSSSSKISSSSCSSEISSSSSVQKNSSSSVAESSNASVKSIYDAVEESGLYTTKDSVAAYLCKFDKLPANYVGKDKGIALYESKTGNAFSKWNFNPWTTINVMIGGDKFSNNEGLLPEGSYHEADVEYSAKNRGTKRLVYQPDCVIYYTADHYETFTRMEVR